MIDWLFRNRQTGEIVVTPATMGADGPRCDRAPFSEICECHCEVWVCSGQPGWGRSCRSATIHGVLVGGSSRTASNFAAPRGLHPVEPTHVTNRGPDAEWA